MAHREGPVTSTVHLVHDPDAVRVGHPGIDEHRFRSIRFAKLPDGQTVKIDPWSIVFTDDAVVMQSDLLPLST